MATQNTSKDASEGKRTVKRRVKPQRLPVIIQSEAMECGLASLAMVAAYYGHDINLNGLRQKFSVSLLGAPLSSLIKMAAQLDLGARALRLDMDDLPKLQLPAILHWDLDHYVVLKKIKGNTAYIHDPATGYRPMKLKDVSDHFTGVALELTPTEDFTPLSARQTMHLSDLWGRLVGMRRGLIQLLILSLILQVTILLSPFYLQLVIDEAVVRLDNQFLLMLALGFGGLVIIQYLSRMMREWTILYFGHQMSFQMVSNIFSHLINLPTDYFEKRHIGDVLSRMASTTPIQTALTQSVVAALIDGLMAIITGIVIFVYSPLLGFVVLLSVLLMLAVTLVFYPRLRRSQEEMIISEAKERSHKIETIRGSIPIKLFSAQSQRMSLWRNLFADYINYSLAYRRYDMWLKNIQGVITGLQTIIVVYLGARLILDGTTGFTVGMLFAFMAYRLSFSDSVTSLYNKFIEFRLLGLHLDRIADIVQSDSEYKNLAMASSEELPVEGDISVRNLGFRYSPNDPWVLKDINLTIHPTDFVAITGPSGGGKTTLLKLLLGLYLPSTGEINIDGAALTPQNILNWRENVGVVMQDDQLLSGSIADNISFFDPDMDMEKIIAVSQRAQIHDEISALPMGYSSLIGDMGSALSGGQKQRLLLARALYRDPKVLFLDEGTANLDAKTEKTIVDIIKELDMTRIIVAHRPAFLKAADYVITIDPKAAAPKS